ncbi:MAG: hypothetical protein KKA32_07955 [Actinobacteria bacterium]|nr:hypothetical protein [Actinomycetota bacterium]
MKATSRQDTSCNADRTQRKHCVYYHAKTGVCTRAVSQDTWQAKLTSQKAR